MAFKEGNIVKVRQGVLDPDFGDDIAGIRLCLLGFEGAEYRPSEDHEPQLFQYWVGL